MNKPAENREIQVLANELRQYRYDLENSLLDKEIFDQHVEEIEASMMQLYGSTDPLYKLLDGQQY